MGKTTHRRERRLVEDLRCLLTSNPLQFVQVWNLYLDGWCRDAAARGRRMSDRAFGKSEEPVFALAEKAERLLEGLGAEADRLVGARTRLVLNHACCKAVAGATDPLLYRFSQDSVLRRLR